ncbi:MAG TPA: ABC transporter ATP-binding protein [Thermoanaerobaculia bacterium]|nr:ABC transporter ATP-binding protein [Thermoanaerobaculia bacterium]
MTSAVVTARGLSKSYGSSFALRQLDLEVEPGEILGYLGPNGAGKTTTIRLLLGLLRPTTGAATIFGLDCWRDRVAIKRRVGYLPGDVRLYEPLSGRRHLELAEALRGGPGRWRELVERLELDLDKRVKSYSKGMRQKLGLVLALMHDPELLILDEPTSALDPLVQEAVYRLLAERREQGATIFFSSHVLSEVQKLCDRVAILRQGMLLHLASVEEVRKLDLRRVTAEVDRPEPCAAALAELGLEVEREGATLRFTARSFDLVVKRLAAFEVRSLSVEPLSLEEVFFELYRGERAAVAAVPVDGLPSEPPSSQPLLPERPR